jgi:23S rRNA (guanosine2251-2'-O)-methyltransferase
MSHPRDRYITLYGRKPVLEALCDPHIAIDKVLIADNARGNVIGNIVQQAQRRGIPVSRESAKYVTRISRNGRHDQGVVADAIAPQMQALSDFIETEGNLEAKSRQLFALDGVKNPSNVGMILRTALAAGLDGIVLPRRGCPDLSPLVVKASAGTAFKAPILRCADLPEALSQLRHLGYTIYGLSADAPANLYHASFSPLSVFVLGNETDGIGERTHPWIDEWISIPIDANAESLNVACSASVVGFELRRRQLAKSSLSSGRWKLSS